MPSSGNEGRDVQEQKRGMKRPSQNEKSRHELVFGLVGPVGVNLEIVLEALRTELKRVHYRAVAVNLAKELVALDGVIDRAHSNNDKWIGNIRRYSHLPVAPKDVRYQTLMSAGNCLRTSLYRPDALALLGVNIVRQYRDALRRQKKSWLTSRAYIFDQLKHPQEVLTLRSIYGPSFFLIGVHSTPSVRRRNLAEKIATSHSQSSRVNKYLAPAADLIARDEAEESGFGQKVGDTFPLADVFVNAADPDSVRRSINRFVELLFGNTHHTPTSDEYGMSLALTAAFRSGALARQVGASIAAADGGEVFALGMNEVPRPGGGVYGADDKVNAREEKLGEDPSDRIRRELLEDILRRLKKEGLLSKAASKLDRGSSIEGLVSRCVDPQDGRPALMKSAEFMTLIEHGRTVHAEMAALMSAARAGIAVKGATLYTSTFPCHLCARHIINAGVKRVVFSEPYPKSRVVALHGDAIEIDGDYSGQSPDPVRFETFVGIAPRRYPDFFSAGGNWPRKDRRGRAIHWVESQDVIPRLPRSHNTYAVATVNEREIFDEFTDTLKQFRLHLRKLKETDLESGEKEADGNSPGLDGTQGA